VHSPFEHTPPEARELLGKRIRELGLKLQGSLLEKYVEQLYRELEARGLKKFKPPCYLSDEWACPDKEPIIGIPFYLADPQLAALEGAVNDVEDEREIMMYLRHEAGHAFNYAYQLYERPDWLELFGKFDAPYVDEYQPVPFSRKYVRHIAGWYAQKHPDEDFAETFAVWLTPRSNWRKRYATWPALAKIEYVDRVAKEFATVDPPKAMPKAELPVEEMQATIEEFYKGAATDETSALKELSFDADLEDIFETSGTPAHEFLGKHRKLIIDKVTYWTGVRRSLVKGLVEAIQKRTRELNLALREGNEWRTLVEVVAYTTTLTMNYLTRGRFVEQ
jgi:putative zinc-binding metallo-peptidase